MQFRDKIFLAFGTILAILGIIATLTWSIEVGLVALLALGLLLLILVMLQRRQLARVQQRTLALLQSQQTDHSAARSTDPNSAKTSHNLANASEIFQQDLNISTTKIIGLLQAQHIALELLNEKLEQSLHNKSN